VHVKLEVTRIGKVGQAHVDIPNLTAHNSLWEIEPVRDANLQSIDFISSDHATLSFKIPFRIASYSGQSIIPAHHAIQIPMTTTARKKDQFGKTSRSQPTPCPQGETTENMHLLFDFRSVEFLRVRMRPSSRAAETRKRNY
jgi:hypothetical protein